MIFFKRTTIAAVSLAALFCSATLFAQDQGGVHVGGDVDIDVETGDVTTSAQGDNATAEANIGAVTGNNTSIAGDVSITAETGDVTTIAQGDDSEACSNIGMVGTSACQDDDN